MKVKDVIKEKKINKNNRIYGLYKFLLLLIEHSICIYLD